MNKAVSALGISALASGAQAVARLLELTAHPPDAFQAGVAAVAAATAVAFAIQPGVRRPVFFACLMSGWMTAAWGIWCLWRFATGREGLTSGLIGAWQIALVGLIVLVMAKLGVRVQLVSRSYR